MGRFLRKEEYVMLVISVMETESLSRWCIRSLLRSRFLYPSGAPLWVSGREWLELVVEAIVGNVSNSKNGHD